MFDLAANLLYLALATMLALALGYGAAEKFRNGDTSMMLRIPEGWPFAAALLPSWLLVLAIVYSVLRSLAEIRLDRPIGPPAEPAARACARAVAAAALESAPISH